MSVSLTTVLRMVVDFCVVVWCAHQCVRCVCDGRLPFIRDTSRHIDKWVSLIFIRIVIEAFSSK